MGLSRILRTAGRRHVTWQAKCSQRVHGVCVACWPTRSTLRGAGAASAKIVAVNPVTGDRAQVECETPSNTFTTDVVLVDASDFPALARVCG